MPVHIISAEVLLIRRALKHGHFSVLAAAEQCRMWLQQYWPLTKRETFEDLFQRADEHVSDAINDFEQASTVATEDDFFVEAVKDVDSEIEEEEVRNIESLMYE